MSRYCRKWKKIAQIVSKEKVAADRIITGSVAAFCLHKCQTRDYNTKQEGKRGCQIIYIQHCVSLLYMYIQITEDVIAKILSHEAGLRTWNCGKTPAPSAATILTADRTPPMRSMTRAFSNQYDSRNALHGILFTFLHTFHTVSNNLYTIQCNMGI